MKILVLNGSPKGKKSNTYRITDAFLNGMKAELSETAVIETVEVASSRIEPCKGCFGCWTATPGKCVIRDDMDELLPKIVEADLIVWSFPLYYYGMPSPIKALLDRNLPLNLPFMTQRPDGGCTHPRRYEGKIADHVLISTCGFYSIENNYEALTRQFDIMFGKAYTKILCPEGELFAHRELDGRTKEYLSYANRAGMEYAAGKRISDETMERLNELLYAPNQFVEMANASWEIQDKTKTLTKEEKERGAAERFTRQMAATYRPGSFDGTERVFEIYYTDAKIGFQLVMGRERCEVRAEGSGPYTTRVETPLTVWQDISRGVYSGEQAMMEGKYKTLGDLKLLISWGRYFGSGAGRGEETIRPRKKTNLTLLILPWFVIWVLLTIHPILGGVAGVLAAAGLHFANLKWELTIYDDISCLCVSVFSLLALLRFDMQIVVPLAYLCFGVLWLLSCATPVPLTAHYSKENYNGDDALKNPLFLKTNRILTVCWGVLYLVTPIWTYFIMGSSMPYLTALANTICPAILGVFTNWFQKWYPARIARG